MGEKGGKCKVQKGAREEPKARRGMEERAQATTAALLGTYSAPGRAHKLGNGGLMLCVNLRSQ